MITCPVKTLILASTSRYRRAQLERLGVPFAAIPPAIDEEAEKDPRLSPAELAIHLALKKAHSLRASHPEATIIGSDQLVAEGARILGKPGTAEAAVEQLLSLAGRTHLLLTAMVVADPSGDHLHLDETRLTLRSLDRAAITRYVARDQPLDCAGAYKIEAAGIGLFERIETQDPSAIEGLPLLALVRRLSALGFAIP